MSNGTRKTIATAIVCLLLALVMLWSNKRELTRIQTIGAESYVADKQGSLQMALPAAAFAMLVFIGLYEGVKRLVGYVLLRLFPDPDSESKTTADRAIKPVRVSGPDWPSGNRNSGRITTIVDDDSLGRG